jgi:hypothetical protein
MDIVMPECRNRASIFSVSGTFVSLRVLDEDGFPPTTCGNDNLLERRRSVMGSISLCPGKDVGNDKPRTRRRKMNFRRSILSSLCVFGILNLSHCTKPDSDAFYSLTHAQLKDKIKGAWALQTIGVTYGGPTEFRYNKRMIPDEIEISWSDTMMLHWMTHSPGLYDDIYMDLTFVEVMEREGLDAPAASHGNVYANAKYWLWHANQQGRYNILNGITPPESGHWLNNPHADDIDFQIEADFAGIMNPGMPNSALDVCDRVGHIMNYGDGFYGGVFVAAMYSYAFIMDEVPSVVEHALETIPRQSTFYQCIRDVISWHAQYPDDWKKNWQLIEDKWGKDIGCPDGAHADFNIDAKMNSAYVVLGLLYGEGDLSKTLEISTRAGQDSDCNPATAGGIIGTIIGYDAIPEYWANGLADIENMDFQFTTISLSKVYEISYKHALEGIRSHGGVITDEAVMIKKQTPRIAAFERSFPGYRLRPKVSIDKRLTHQDLGPLELEFEGAGVVVRGKVSNADFPKVYALTSQEQTLDNYKLAVEFDVDGKLEKTMHLPLYFIERAHELFFKYELSPGKHTLRMNVLNPHPKMVLEVWDMLAYGKD